MDRIDSFPPESVLEIIAADLPFALAGGVFLLLLIFIPVKLISFQISLLGKDAWLRLRNDGIWRF